MTHDPVATAARNLVLAHEMKAVLRAANASGVACAPLRGVALSEQLYGDCLRRPTGDIDVLVRRDQLPAARRLFSGLGYHEVEPRAGFSDAFEYTLEYFKDGPIDLIAEPHVTIAYPPFAHRMDMDGVWRRSTPATILGVPTQALSTEDLLIHLCLHWLHHQKDAPPMWLGEIDALIRSQPIQWMLVSDIAGPAGVEPLVRRALDEVAGAFGTPVPEALLRSRMTSSQQIIVNLLTDDSHLRGRERLALLMSLPDLSAKARYAAAFLFPSAHFIREQYGVSTWRQIGWTYVRRTAGLIWDGSIGLIRLLAARKRSP